VDTNGYPHSMYAETADVTDRNGALEMLKSGAADLTNVKIVLCDGGYSGENFSNSVTEIIPNAKVEVVKRNELLTFVVLPIRWIVERTFGWLDNAAVFGKIASGNSTLHFKCTNLLSFV
jgi:transposase